MAGMPQKSLAAYLWLLLSLGFLMGVTTRPTTVPAEQAAVQAYQTFIEASLTGDAAGMRARLAYEGPVQTRMADAVIDFNQALVRLREVSARAFGDQDLQVLLGTSSDKIRQEAKKAVAEMQGARAVIHFADGSITYMIHLDGQWKLPVSSMDLARQQADELARRQTDELNHQTVIYNELADEVADRKFHTPRQAAEKLRERLLKPASQPS